MGNWSESELNWYLKCLTSGEDLALALSTVAKIGMDTPPMPTGDTRVIKRLELFVEARDVWCIVDWRVGFASGFTHGELRWLAARILVCEYAYAGIDTPIILEDVVQPFKGVERGNLVMQHQMTFEELVEQGLMPHKTEIHKPKDYAWCCSKEAVEERIRNQQQSK